MKKRKANKQHDCDSCNLKINKGEIYEYEKLYNSYGEKFSTHTIRECKKCILDRPKIKYKSECSRKRGKLRAKDCPDANFVPVWQGGWDNGTPDGGDIRYECHNCNLNCI